MSAIELQSKQTEQEFERLDIEHFYIIPYKFQFIWVIKLMNTKCQVLLY